MVYQSVSKGLLVTKQDKIIMNQIGNGCRMYVEQEKLRLTFLQL
jgi:hypothetical protein